MNSIFFHKRIESSEFIRQLTIGIIVQIIEKKYEIKLEISNQIILKNKKLMGSLNVQNIRKCASKVVKPTIETIVIFIKKKFL